MLQGLCRDPPRGVCFHWERHVLTTMLWLQRSPIYMNIKYWYIVMVKLQAPSTFLRPLWVFQQKRWKFNRCDFSWLFYTKEVPKAWYFWTGTIFFWEIYFLTFGIFLWFLPAYCFSAFLVFLLFLSFCFFAFLLLCLFCFFALLLHGLFSPFIAFTWIFCFCCFAFGSFFGLSAYVHCNTNDWKLYTVLMFYCFLCFFVCYCFSLWIAFDGKVLCMLLEFAFFPSLPSLVFASLLLCFSRKRQQSQQQELEQNQLQQS